MEGTLRTSIPADFDALNSLPAAQKADGYSALLDKILARPVDESLEGDLSAYVAFLLVGSAPVTNTKPAEALSIIAARPLLTSFITRLASLSSVPDLQIGVASTAIRLLAARVVSFEEQDYNLKLLLADAHQANEDFTQTARALETISLSTSNTQRATTDAERIEIWIRIARCYLEEDDATAAATYINRAKNIIHNISTTTTEGKQTRIQFQLCQARVLDSQRHFLDAAGSYHSLSFESMIDEDDRLQSLTAAVICAVLAPAGPQRARMLAKLYKDERSSQLPDHAILENIYLDRVLDPTEVASFAAKLMPHHLARTADGSTVLERAVLEHNLLGASRLYRNISVHDMAALLGTDSDKAEQYAASMIEQGRLRGSIDQIDGMIFFAQQGTNELETSNDQSDEKSGEAANGYVTTASMPSELRIWESGVAELLAEVENITEMIQSRAPDLYAKVVGA